MYQAADSTQECGERQYRASSVSESISVTKQNFYDRDARISRRNFSKRLTVTVLKTVDERRVRCKDDTDVKMFDKNKRNESVSVKNHLSLLILVFFRENTRTSISRSLFIDFYFSKELLHN